MSDFTVGSSINMYETSALDIGDSFTYALFFDDYSSVGGGTYSATGTETPTISSREKVALDSTGNQANFISSFNPIVFSDHTKYFDAIHLNSGSTSPTAMHNSSSFVRPNIGQVYPRRLT